MSVANTQLRVSELNFNDIKSNLKNYLKGKPEFLDYDFEASTLSRILDILAYNTYYASYYLNMVGNEMYLDSATLRQNVVSRAKELGYTPASMKSAYTDLTITIIPEDSPNKIIIPKYTKFKAKDDNDLDVVFYTDSDYIVSSTDGITFTETVRVYEGNILTFTYTYDTEHDFFEIPNSNLDTESIKVFVKENLQSSTQTKYTLASDITEINSESEVFFLQENANGNFEIYFGDGVLGKHLELNNIITIECRFCNGESGNYLNNLTAPSYVGYNKDNTSVTYTPSAISTAYYTVGGSDKESIDSIKFLAPKFFGRQLRNVTDDDYTTYILENFRDISSVVVWGGDVNDPPLYGKVIIAAKPITGFVLSNSRREEIRSNIKKLNVQTVDPLFVDPIFTYLNLNLDITYNSGITSLSSNSILNKLLTAIETFETQNLGLFNQPFYISKFQQLIQKADKSIVDSDIKLLLEKRITPIYSSNITYKLSFSDKLSLPYEGALGTVSSEGFKLTNQTNITYIDDDGFGNIRLYYLNDQNNKVYLNNKAGTVDYENGIILLKNMDFEYLLNNAVEFKVYAKPNKLTYKPQLNEILLISNPGIILYDEVIDLEVARGNAETQGNYSPIQTNSILSTVAY